MRVSKMRRILRWFQIRENNWNKAHPEKVICQKVLQDSSKEEDKLQFCKFFWPLTFLLEIFLRFSEQFQNQRREEKDFRSH
jgi:hypothetical protein